MASEEMIPMVDGDEQATLERLRGDFPGWKFWRHHQDGQPGDWWAVREDVLTGKEMYAGLAHSLAADTEASMRVALKRQREIYAKTQQAKRSSRWPHPEYAVNASYH